MFVPLPCQIQQALADVVDVVAQEDHGLGFPAGTAKVEQGTMIGYRPLPVAGDAQKLNARVDIAFSTLR